jgi:hypothetical protein
MTVWRKLVSRDGPACTAVQAGLRDLPGHDACSAASTFALQPAAAAMRLPKTCSQRVIAISCVSSGIPEALRYLAEYDLASGLGLFLKLLAQTAGYVPFAGARTCERGIPASNGDARRVFLALSSKPHLRQLTLAN